MNSKIKNKKLLITQCTDPLMWYADKIGKTLDFVKETEDGYWSREDAGYINIVKKKDAVFVLV